MKRVVDENQVAHNLSFRNMKYSQKKLHRFFFFLISIMYGRERFLDFRA